VRTTDTGDEMRPSPDTIRTPGHSMLKQQDDLVGQLKRAKLLTGLSESRQMHGRSVSTFSEFGFKY
jgi:hypothetical protein